jgi:peptidoglycan/xylan/chitin deacetylase (PgdA/CDA1 family)
MLHRFAEPQLGLRGHDPALLRNCLARLRREKRPILALDDALRMALAGEPLPYNAFIFTMDDGFWDQGLIGAEIFLEFDVPVTIFLITGFVDGTTWQWDNRLDFIFEQTEQRRLEFEFDDEIIRGEINSDDERHALRRRVRAKLKTVPFSDIEHHLAAIARVAEIVIPASPPPMHRALDWNEVRRLESRGTRFGPHTISHGIVSRMSDETAHRELLGGWDRLCAEVAHPVPVYGWPTGRRGDFTTRDMSILEEAGFLGALATQDDYADFSRLNNPGARFAIRRFSMPDSEAKFFQYGSAVERMSQLARRTPAQS